LKARETVRGDTDHRDPRRIMPFGADPRSGLDSIAGGTRRPAERLLSVDSRGDAAADRSVGPMVTTPSAQVHGSRSEKIMPSGECLRRALLGRIWFVRALEGRPRALLLTTTLHWLPLLVKASKWFWLGETSSD
jgi:hypothetical protein